MPSGGMGRGQNILTEVLGEVGMYRSLAQLSALVANIAGQPCEQLLFKFVVPPMCDQRNMPRNLASVSTSTPKRALSAWKLSSATPEEPDLSFLPFCLSFYLPFFLCFFLTD